MNGLVAACKQHPEVAPLSSLGSFSVNATSFYKQTQAPLHEPAIYDGPASSSGEGKETLDIRAALWSLGHIGASELG